MQFSQFTVRDDRCAMKVGTDGLLLGAWPKLEDARAILDIGTGSGLVALMAAQRAPNAHVTAVELEPSAAAQARENFACSPFSHRLHLVEADALSWSAEAAPGWDAILCNPPFFRNKPKSPSLARNLARHDDSLPIEALFRAIDRLAAANGVLHVIWPTDRIADLSNAGKACGWHEHERLSIHGTPEQPAERVISVWSRAPIDERKECSIAVEVRPFSSEGTPDRTREFKHLMAPFMSRYAAFLK